jgi:hypothetical protein
MVQEKAEKYGDAIVNLKEYIKLSPNADDTETVKTFINKLEYKQEKADLGKNILTVLTTGVKTEKGGSNMSANFRKKFFLEGEKIKANIISPYYTSYNQTVPVEFDGSILKFSYTYYNCPGAPGLKYYPCPWDVSISAKVVSTSPLRFKVKEIWDQNFLGHAHNEYDDGEWEFKQEGK